jgi:long-chain acyl-CoA synthetase
LFVYTSGTTGKPKGIRRRLPEGDVDKISHDGALFSRAFNFQPFEGPMLVSTGMFHGGSHSYYMGGLAVGHSLVIMAKFDPEETLALIEKHRITTAYMVPTQFHRLLRLPDDVRSRHDLSSLRVVAHSAAPCPRDVKQKMFDWWGPVIWETYGGMEGAATIAKPHHWLAKPGTVGRAIRGMRLAILDDDGNELPAGEVGHIYLENDIGFEYHNDPDQTRAAYKGRRFSLGDVGYLDEDGFLFISDRAKDMLITGGVNVYPAEIEAVLLSHPKVRDCGVVGIPDDDWGESPLAIVQPVDGTVADEALTAELDEFCRSHLASYKCPRHWEFRDELPRTEAGKLYKRKIRDEYVAARA